MSVSISNAWSWSFKRSPLMAIWRSSRSWLAPNKDASALLQAAALPAEVDAAIRTTVTRTKLWRDEREQIARELIVHAQDAIEAGRTSEQIVETFGDPRRVARLMRRSMKRKRPLVWQAYRFFRRAMGVVVLLMITGYGALAVRFYTGKPAVRTDYMAQLDVRNSGYGADQRSWPVIAEVGPQWDRASFTLFNKYPAMNMFPQVSPSDEGYIDVAATVRAMEPQLQRLREAAQRPVIGAPMGYDLDQIHEEGVSWIVGIIPAEPEAYKDRSIFEAMLPQLSWTRRLAVLLSFDARLAIDEGDPQRAVDDLVSMAHLARQCAGEPYMISTLSAIGIDSAFGTRIEQILRDQPGVFSKQQLVELAHANALANGTQPNLQTERIIFQDLLQRTYTDNGNGNGRMTPDGAQLLLLMEPWYAWEANRTRSGYQALAAAAMPSVLLAMNDRATEQAIYNAVINRIEQVLAQGPRSIGWLAYEDLMLAWRADHAMPVLSPAELTMPAMGELVQNIFKHQMSDQAVSAMLAIEVYRIVHGRLPESLDEVPGSLLPEIPQDAFDIGMPIRYMQGEQGGYVLYSVGADGDDDDGASPGSAKAKVSDLFLRYPFKIMQDEVFKPTVELDDAGQPKIGDPAGPNGDWILVDTRPQTGVESEPAADS